MTAAPRTTSIFMFGACLGPIPSVFPSLCSSRNTSSPEREGNRRRREGYRGKRRQERARACLLFIRRFSLRSIRVHSPWIRRRPVTPALSDRPHCFNLPPKHRRRRRSPFLVLFLQGFLCFAAHVRRGEPVHESSRHLAVVLVAVDMRRGNHELLS